MKSNHRNPLDVEATAYAALMTVLAQTSAGVFASDRERVHAMTMAAHAALLAANDGDLKNGPSKAALRLAHVYLIEKESPTVEVKEWFEAIEREIVRERGN